MKYRVKTKEEFIKEYGENWRSHHPNVTYVTSMDKYLGKEITKEEHLRLALHNNILLFDGWWFNIGMITGDKLNIPSYKPRKLIKND